MKALTTALLAAAASFALIGCGSGPAPSTTYTRQPAPRPPQTAPKPAPKPAPVPPPAPVYSPPPAPAVPSDFRVGSYGFWAKSHPDSAGGRLPEVDFMSRNHATFRPSTFYLPANASATYTGSFKGVWTHKNKSGVIDTDVRLKAHFHNNSNTNFRLNWLNGTIGTHGIIVDGHNRGPIHLHGDIRIDGQFNIDPVFKLGNGSVVGGFTGDNASGAAPRQVGGEVKITGFTMPYSPNSSPSAWDLFSELPPSSSRYNRQGNSIVGAFVADRQN